MIEWKVLMDQKEALKTQLVIYLSEGWHIEYATVNSMECMPTSSFSKPYRVTDRGTVFTMGGMVVLSRRKQGASHVRSS